jgi:SAM-dependent methyltransferase
MSDVESGAGAPKVDYYTVDRYWNDLPAVVDHQTRRLPGPDDEWWTAYLKRVYCTPPRKRALVIGCGNGWVDRQLADLGIAEHFDAFDVDPAFLAACEAERGDRPIRYFVSDFRSFEATERYDLIVNVAALHHAQYLYHHCSRLAAALTPDGIFVHWEYIGPDRNQYRDDHVAHMEAVNQAMPERFHTSHRLRPYLSAMIVGDPTEAVHASEIVRAVGQYFTILERHDTGGGLAYQMLWNNIAEFEDPSDTEAADVLAELLDQDGRETDSGAIPPLFTFMIAGHRPDAGRSLIARFDRRVREPAREALARRMRNLYLGQLVRFVGRHHLWDPRRWTAEGRQRRPLGN